MVDFLGVTDNLIESIIDGRRGTILMNPDLLLDKNNLQF
jgi:hypothetical protein